MIDTPLSVKKQTLTILFWNGFWNWPYFGMGEGNAGFVSNNCKYQNCYTINDRDKLTNNLSSSPRPLRNVQFLNVLHELGIVEGVEEHNYLS